MCIYKDPDEGAVVTKLVVRMPSLAPAITSSNEQECRRSSSALIHHLHYCWDQILWMPQSKTVMHLFQSSSLVRHTLLAISACHLRHTANDQAQYGIAENLQQSMALNHLRRAINKASKKNFGATDLNAFLLSACLLNVLAFALPEPDRPLSRGSNLSLSWIFSQQEGWLTLQAGLGPLLMSVSPDIEATMKFISEVFLGTAEEDWVFNVVGRDGLKGVPKRWMLFFGLEDPNRGCECAIGLSDNSKADIAMKSPSEIYRSPVALLVRLRTLRPIPYNAFRTLQFLGKIGAEFRTLLQQGDKKAIWVLGYWFGLLCRFENLWWCQQRTKRDYKAVCSYLERFHPVRQPVASGVTEIWNEMMRELSLASTY